MKGLSKAQHRYLDKNVPFKPIFYAGQSVFVSVPPTYALIKFKRRRSKERYELLSKCIGSFKVWLENQDIFTFIKGGVLRKISIDHLTAVSGVKEQLGCIVEGNVDFFVTSEEKGVAGSAKIPTTPMEATKIQGMCHWPGFWKNAWKQIQYIVRW